MYRHPHVAAVMQNKKSARHRHEKHEDGNHRDGDPRRKSPRRNRLPAPLSVEIAIVPVIAAIWRPSPAPTAAAGILDNEFDFRRCNCARHDDFLAPLSFLFSSLPWPRGPGQTREEDRKSTRLNSSHVEISYAVFCLKKKNHKHIVSYRGAKAN